MPGRSARQIFQPALLLQAGVRALLKPDGLLVVVAQRLKAVPAKPHHVAYELSHQRSSPPRFEGATCSHDSRPSAQGCSVEIALEFPRAARLAARESRRYRGRQVLDLGFEE